ncbi:MAG: SufS family cysteine desulfurase [Spirochaetales bacterium]|nr:SufS family cysteine desulfurase [Spirochaetales bacterium]
MKEMHLTNALKKDFPLFQAHPELVYLDNAATSQKPQVVLDALNTYYTTQNANVHRAVYGLAEQSTLAYEGARARIANHLNAASPQELVFVRGATEGLNLLAWSLSQQLLSSGDIILVTEMEHHANLVPWQQAALRMGAELVAIPLLPDATLDMNFLKTLEADGRAQRVKICAVSTVSNAFGTTHPLSQISSWCKNHGISLVVDGAQSVPHGSWDVQELGADFLVFSGHKVYGPMGSGVVWGKEALWDQLPPWQTGGEMISRVTLTSSTWNSLPHKFEAGTPDVAAAVGLAAAMDWMVAFGLKHIQDREAFLSQKARQILQEVEGLTLIGPQNQKHQLVFSFTLEGVHSHDVAQYLDRDHVAIRSGHHCAQPAMRALQLGSTARASLALYNTEEDLHCLGAALQAAREYFL